MKFEQMESSEGPRWEDFEFLGELIWGHQHKNGEENHFFARIASMSGSSGRHVCFAEDP
jgi:hypothetical protein